jgi:hypothetical protein
VHPTKEVNGRELRGADFTRRIVAEGLRPLEEAERMNKRGAKTMRCIQKQDPEDGWISWMTWDAA